MSVFSFLYICVLHIVYFSCVLVPTWQINVLNTLIYRPRIKEQRKTLKTLAHVTIGNRAFGVASACVWNSLPPDVNTSMSLPVFKRRLMTLLFKRSVWIAMSDCTVFGLTLPHIIFLFFFIFKCCRLFCKLHGTLVIIIIIIIVVVVVVVVVIGRHSLGSGRHRLNVVYLEVDGTSPQ